LLQALQPSLDRIRPELERGFLGRQRAFVTGLRLERVEKSVLYLRANVAPSSPVQSERAAQRIGELMSRELGTPVEVRILSGRARPFQAPELEPLIDAGNETAHKVLDAIEHGRARHMNPVFLYGPKGIGKTFLVRSLLRRLRRKCVTITARQFQAGLARARRAAAMLAWRRTLLDADVLVVDEVHRLAGKECAQRELALLLDELRARGVQVLLLARHHPKRIWKLERGLRSRFLAGFTVEVSVPRPATRRTFLDRLKVAPEVGARLLEARSRGQTLGALRHEVERLQSAGTSAAVADNDQIVADLVERVAEVFAVEVRELQGRQASRRVTLPRQVVIFLARQAGISGSELSRRFGWRSPSAATYAVRRVEARLHADAEFRRQVQACE
jgi:chromosomal replication initiator protein